MGDKLVERPGSSDGWTRGNGNSWSALTQRFADFALGEKGSAAMEGLERLSQRAVPIANALGEAAQASIQRSVRRSRLERADVSEVLLPLLAARLSYAAYEARSDAELERRLSGLLHQPRLLHFERQLANATSAQWFLVRARLPLELLRARGAAERAEAEGDALFLVFRGTHSVTDVLTDLVFEPAAGPHGNTFHSGFLRCVAEDIALRAQLEKHAAGGEPVYLVGHSLGGALALTLLGAGLLPDACTGRVTAITLGSPAVFHGRIDEAKLPAAMRRARVISVVNANDVVPRLLGSPMAMLRAALSALGATETEERVVKTLEGYSHLSGLELLYVSDGRAMRVPSDEREAVLHLHDSLSLSAIPDHTRYVNALQRCVGLF